MIKKSLIVVAGAILAIAFALLPVKGDADQSGDEPGTTQCAPVMTCWQM